MMKKLILVLMLLLLTTPVYGQTVNVWYSVEKGQWKTVAWDAVTQLMDGDPIPAPTEAALSYNVYVRNFNTQAVIPIASGIAATSQEIVLPLRGKYLAGVEAQLLYVGETEPAKSTISWSETVDVCQGGQTFGMKFQTPPGQARQLR